MECLSPFTIDLLLLQAEYQGSSLAMPYKSGCSCQKEILQQREITSFGGAHAL